MQIDLEPHEFRSQRSKRNANIHGLLALAALALLAFVWWNRGDLTTETLFSGAALFGGFAGAGLIVFLNQWRGV